MMARVDHHSHILNADIVDMVASAKANNIVEYSITEHVSQFRELRESVRFGSVHSKGRIFDSLKEYEDEFRKIDEEASGMKVNRGLEVDFSRRFETRVANFVNQEDWDILLCSVHEFEDGTDIERKLGRPADQDSARRRWHEYFRAEQMALESDLVPFKVLAHPVRMARSIEAVPPDVDLVLLDLAKMAQRRQKALELNGNDIVFAPQLVRMLAAACSKAGCRVSLGSDAHRPRDVFRNIEAAIQLVDEFKLELLSGANPHQQGT